LHDFLSFFRPLPRSYAVRDNRGNQNTTIDPNNPSYDSYLYYFNVCDDVKLSTISFPDVEAKCAETTGAVSGSRRYSHAHAPQVLEQ
jgi:hypothetical protein